MKHHERLNFSFGRRTPMVLQTEAAECGLACLAMVAGHYGQHHELSSLRHQFGTSLKGVTLKHVVAVAEQLGFATRPVRLDLDELDKLAVPSLLHWDLNHFVVLVKVAADYVIIHDPAVGELRLTMSRLSEHFTGVALQLSPTHVFQQASPAPRVRITDLFGRFVGLSRAFVYLFGMALLLEFFGLVTPLFMSLVVDEALVSANMDLLNVLALGFALFALVEAGVAWMRSRSLMALRATVDVQASENLLQHLLKLPVPFFEARHLGDVVARFNSQKVILRALTGDFIAAILDGIMVTITLVVMMFIAPALTAVAVVTSLLYGLLRWLSFAPLRQAEKESIVWAARADSHFLETLRGIRSIKLNNAQPLRRTQWLNLLVESFNRDLTEGKISLNVRTAKAIAVSLSVITVIWLGAHSILTGTMSIGLLLAFLSYFNVFLRRTSGLIDVVVALRMLGLHAERLADIALSSPERVEAPRVQATRQRGGMSVELRNVSFRYNENDPWVLRHLTFKVNSGEWVAISGPSGCGKSTLVKLLAGLWKPTEGEILVNGVPLEDFGLEEFRRQTGVVLQDDQLFSGSIAQNISFFAEQQNQTRIETCAGLAAVHDDITALPMRYSTLVGDMGTVLSGGQKQRILLARAIYKAPSLLLLDEATSHLDVSNEQKVNRALSRMKTTRIVIAHRPETLRAAQRVIELENGRLVLQGRKVKKVTI